ncbi:AAA family ATPase [Candidatus Desantisbacteria bacterium]|nr:AAA family ATPase [Candidatus Desantisbacteria bacterium]
MINKISKIKNLGIFDSYQWNSNLPDFKRFNLIYGWNGSGKTTLSQLFASFPNGKSETYAELEYKIQTSDGDLTHGNTFNKQIRVFNQDYISENIDILAGKAKPIFILGKENKELVEAIKNDEKILHGDPEKKDDIGKLKKLEQKKNEIDQKEVEKGKCFTDIAKIISSNTSGVSARNYRKNNAEQAFAKLQTKQLQSEEKINNYLLTLKQIEKPVLNEIIINNIKEKVKSIILKSKILLKRTVETVIIERLKKNVNISKWVEQGLELHIIEKSTNCEFCNQPLPKERISDLLAFFNDADKKLKDEIDILLSEIDELYDTIKNLNIFDKANLYDELQENYLLKTSNFNICKTDLLNSILIFKEIIKNKKSNTTDSLELNVNIDTESIISAITSVNSEINSHNKKTNNFTKAKEEATTKLENHYLSEIFDDVKLLESNIKILKEEINLLEKGNPKDSNDIGIEGIQKRIIENKNKISTSGTACEEINNQLKTFLGRDELAFEVAEQGYLIKRKGRIAKNLSEGEKTAIAFVYFTIHLKDHDFKISDGIVVVDDPICSLDANSLFQAFAFLKNAVKESAQVFILTHNFDFLKLLLDWLKRYPNNQGGKEFYMIKNLFSNGNRIAILDYLDELLKNYENEYQYLFKVLSDFKSDGTIASVYHIPNIARKLLENFLMIMCPNCENIYKKLESIKFDENKKTAIYKFTNDQSHMTGKGFEPSLVQESQKNVEYLLDMMNSAFPKHYKILQESVVGNQS